MSIQLQDVCKAYGDFKVLDHFNLTIDRKRIHCLFGPSGCGKSTLLTLIAGISAPDLGTIKGTDVLKFSYVFQEERLLPWRTVKENIQFVLQSHKDKHSAHTQVQRVLELVELTQFQNHYPNELSGGMKQRVSLARAFAYAGDVLAMDEPFKGLHFDLKRDLMDAIVAYWQNYSPYTIFITHDVEEALYIADDIYMLEGPPLQIKKQVYIPVPHDVRKRDPDSLLPYRAALLARK